MLSETEKKKALDRLKRLQGQVGGIHRMIDEDQYCIDVLNQIAAVQGGLAEVSKKLLSRHLETCVRTSLRSKDAARQDRVLEELMQVFARYGRIETQSRRK